MLGATANAGVENAGVDSRGGKCRSRLAVWKAEPRLYRESLKLLPENCSYTYD